MPFIGFTIGNGEPSMTEGLQIAYQLLQKEYRVQFMDLDNLRDFPEKPDALFIVSPRENLSYWELYLIDQYIMRGGKVAFLLDRSNVDMEKQVALQTQNTLDGLLKWYGVGFEEKLVIDLQCNVIPVARELGGMRMQTITQYPYFLKVSDFHKDYPVVKDLASIDLLFASPLDMSISVPDGIKRDILFSSSESSGLRDMPVDISPEKKYSQSDFDLQKIPLAAVLTGSFKSLFKENEIPEYTGPDTTSGTPFPEFIASSVESRVVAIGNGTFITDNFRPNSPGFVMLVNLADWLTQDKGLISIRSRAATARTLEPVSDNSKKLIKYANILLMPIIVIIFGLVRWQFKRSVRRKELA
jgi:gliding-associated putative ABC transporter substrate-binding component GldG